VTGKCKVKLHPDIRATVEQASVGALSAIGCATAVPVGTTTS